LNGTTRANQKQHLNEDENQSKQKKSNKQTGSNRKQTTSNLEGNIDPNNSLLPPPESPKRRECSKQL